ncbi:MAG: hypothetical protein HGA78_01175 [Nitrospirales bacterium]|nr:hypothetical protein [Nitrospirales bacterium]
MSPERLQEIIDLAHSDRANPLSEALIEMIDEYCRVVTELQKIKKGKG